MSARPAAVLLHSPSLLLYFLFPSLLRHPPRSPLFPYTTLFRSVGVDPRERDVGSAHLDTVPPRIGDERLRRVEAHRLRAQQPREKRTRIVQPQPGARVHDQGEADRVTLGEPEVRERLDLLVDHIGFITRS